MKSKQLFLLKVAAIVVLTANTMLSFAQLPADLPWPGQTCAGQNIILQSGIAAITCAVTENVNPANRYTFGLVNVDGALPGGGGRIDVTNSQAVYHHPSWTVTELGNVFGIAINETNGCIFVTASSNYGTDYAYVPAILQYGTIGGGANDLGAAGTVYKIDAVTGQASVFAQLPQQLSTFLNYDCESNNSFNRTTGVGLGNIVYDETHDQYFVSNMEDGRIYRLDAAGVVLDSYDPLIYDDGAAGVSNLTDLAYGLAITDDGTRLFFGTIATPNGQGNQGVGTVPIYAIDIMPNGGFTGTIDNTVLPAGIPNNYVGTETLQINLPVGSSTGCTFAFRTTYQVSDLDFDSAGNLLVGVRVGCSNSLHSSYNHWGETSLVAPDATGIYNNEVGEYDISVTGECGNDDGYGGVATYDVQDGSGDVQYLASSSDILQESGPHGIVVFSSTAPTNSPVSLGAISYGEVDNGDPKGVGGDVEVFSLCRDICPIICSSVIGQNITCPGASDGSLEATGADAVSGTYLYSLDAFATAGQTSGIFSGLAAGTYIVSIQDAADSACTTTCEAVVILGNDNPPKCINEFGEFTITKRRP